MAMVNKKKSVVDAVASHLGNISTANDYNFDLNDLIHNGEPNRESVNSGHPEIGILRYVEESELKPPSKYRKRLEIEIVGITPGSVQFDNLRDDALKLEADIEKSLTADPTLGGEVDWIELTTTATTLFKEGAHARIAMTFVAHYLITEGTP